MSSLLKTQDRGELVTQPGGRLAAHGQREPARLAVEHGERRSRLDGAGRNTLVDQVELDDMRSLAEGRGRRRRITVAHFAGEISARRGPYARRVRAKRGAGIRHRGQPLVTDIDRLDRVARLAHARRDHRRDGFTDVPRRVDREGVPWRGRRGRAVGAAEIAR